MRSQTIIYIDPQELILGFAEYTNEEIGALFRSVLTLAEDVNHRDIAYSFPFVVDIRGGRELSSRPYIPESIRQNVFDRDGRICAYCGATERLEIDHIIPYSICHEHKIDNLQVLCKPCNCSKGARI